MSTSRVLPSNGPGDGNGASISMSFVIWGAHDDTDGGIGGASEFVTIANGVGAGHVSVFITMFSGFDRPGRICVWASFARLNGVRFGCFKVLWASFASVFGLYFSGRLTLNEFERKYLCDGDPTGLIGADCGLALGIPWQ